ncbi:MAG: histidinol dehydrogenase [Syntrophobacterales bacterium]|nr:histidinol dehydrogenase [Syntrophobacterales bacterium]
MKIIRTDEQSIKNIFKQIKDRGKLVNLSVRDVVRKIVQDVAARGDAALFKYTEKFDGVSLNVCSVEVSKDEVDKAVKYIKSADYDILKLAARRIEEFHKKQLVSSWIDSDEDGIDLGQLIRPLNRVGIYAPGGLAIYPSTVLMAAIPARVAGVSEIILVTPAKNGKLNPLILAAAKLGGISRIFKIGGAQAVAALAYGTESIPSVDKIIGPGNVYVAAAKKMVYGQVGIDMIAGPSEIVVISDGTANPEVVAADLLSQAEHDEMASAILLTQEEDFAWKVSLEIQIQLKNLGRESIATKAIKQFGVIIITRDMDEAIDIANRFAPEHLELMVEKPQRMLDKIINAGAVFLGNDTPEAVGDYMAGPSHILPTGGTARFSSPLGVYDFIKRTSVISFTGKSLKKYGDRIARFAEIEGLDAHKRSVMVRLKKNT